MNNSNRIVSGCYSQEEVDRDQRIAALEAENAELKRERDALQVCGNCEYWRPGSNDDADLIDPLPWCAQVGAPTVDGPDSCHFTPSRWTPGGGGS